MNTADDSGITFFDTADIYGAGKSEIALGENAQAIRGPAHKIVVQSKCALSYQDAMKSSITAGSTS